MDQQTVIRSDGARTSLERLLIYFAYLQVDDLLAWIRRAVLVLSQPNAAQSQWSIKEEC